MNKHIFVYFVALLLLVGSGVWYGALSYYWGSQVYLMCLAPYGIFIGALWHRAAFPLAAVSVASLAGAVSFPVAHAYC